MRIIQEATISVAGRDTTFNPSSSIDWDTNSLLEHSIRNEEFDFSSVTTLGSEIAS